MGKIKATHTRSWQHGHGFGELRTDVLLRLQKGKICAFTVWSGLADTPEQVECPDTIPPSTRLGQGFIRRISPKLSPSLPVQPFSGGLSQAVSQRFAKIA